MIGTISKSQWITYSVVMLLVYRGTLALPISHELIFVTIGESFTFTCGPSNDPLEGISVTLDDNKQSDGIVTEINESTNGTVLYEYRRTKIEDDGTRIVCSAGLDNGIIYLTVFYGPVINENRTNYTIREGTTLSIPLSITANPMPSPPTLLSNNSGGSSASFNMTLIKFPNISRYHIGDYSFQISNNISTTFYNFSVDVVYPPTFANPDLPDFCLPSDSNVTYSCTSVSEVLGNPYPTLTANVTELGDSFVLLDDTVMIMGGSMVDDVIVKCIADNGIEPVAIAMGYIQFGDVPSVPLDIQTTPNRNQIAITWEAPATGGCSIKYYGNVTRVDTNDTTLFNATMPSFTATALYPGAVYLISIRAINQLGEGDYATHTVLTLPSEPVVSNLMAMRLNSTVVKVTWDLNSTGGVNLTAMIRIYLSELVNGIAQGNISVSVTANDRMAVLPIQDGTRYQIVLVATNEAALSTTLTTEYFEMGSGGTAVSASQMLKLMMITLIVIVVLIGL